MENHHHYQPRRRQPAARRAAGLLLGMLAIVALATPALAVSYDTSQDDTSATSTGATRYFPVRTDQAATVRAVQTGDECWVAVIVRPYKFSTGSKITLPRLGAIYLRHEFDATFVRTTTVHENWHRRIHKKLVDMTYGRLEAWSAGYRSNKFMTAAQARAAGRADLAKALRDTAAKFAAEWPNRLINHAGAVAVRVRLADGKRVWRSRKPDWGKPAYRNMCAIRLTFTKRRGNCPMPVIKPPIVIEEPIDIVIEKPIDILPEDPIPDPVIEVFDGLVFENPVDVHIDEPVISKAAHEFHLK